MAGSGEKRSRGVFKGLWFSDEEWRRVERRMRIAGASDFAKFARPALLDGEIRVERVAFDPSVVRAELSRIGNQHQPDRAACEHRGCGDGLRDAGRTGDAPAGAGPPGRLDEGWR